MSFKTLTKQEYLEKYPSISNAGFTDDELARQVYSSNLKQNYFLESNYSYDDFKKDFFGLQKTVPATTRGLFLSESELDEVRNKQASSELLNDIGRTVGATAKGWENFRTSTVDFFIDKPVEFVSSFTRTDEENKERKIEKEARKELREINRAFPKYFETEKSTFTSPDGEEIEIDVSAGGRRSPLSDIAYLANTLTGGQLNPRGDLSKIRKVHELAVEEGRYDKTFKEFLNDPKGIKSKYGMNEAYFTIDSLPEQYKQDLLDGFIPENKTELSNFEIEATRPSSFTGKAVSFVAGDLAPFIFGATKFKAAGEYFIRAPNWLKKADAFVETAKQSSKLPTRFWGVLAKGGTNFARYAPSSELTAQVLLNPYEDRLTKIVGEMMAQDDSFATDVIEFLETEDTDSELEARLDLALEGVFTWGVIGTGFQAAKTTAFSTLKGIKNSLDKSAIFVSRAINPHYKGRAATIRDKEGNLIPESVEQFALLHNPKEGFLGNFLHGMMERIVLPVMKSGGALSRQMTAVKQQAQQNMASDSYGIEKSIGMLDKQIDDLLITSGSLKINKEKGFEISKGVFVNTKEKLWEHIGRLITKDYPKVKASDQAKKATAKRYNRKTGKFEDTKIPLLKSLDFEKDLKFLPSELSGSIRNIRLHIDEMSSTIMNTKDGFVSPEIKAIIQDNLGKYLKTQYEFFMNPYWKPTQTVMDRYVSYLSTNRSFINHVKKNIKQFKRSAGTEDVYRYTARQYVNSLVNNKGQKNVLSFNLFEEGTGTFRGIHKSLFSQKQKLSPEAQAFYGKVTDPKLNIISTVKSLSRYIETDKMFKRFLELGEGVSIHAREKGRYNTPIGIKSASSPQATAQTLVLPKLGALDGMYTTPKLAKIFNEIGGVHTNYFQYLAEGKGGFISQYMFAPLVALKTLANVNATVLSNTTQIRNFNAGPLFLIANGRLPNIEAGKKSYQTVAETILNMSNPEIIAFEKMLIKEGVINSSVVVSELKAAMQSVSANQGALQGRVKNFFRENPDANKFVEGTKEVLARKPARAIQKTIGKAQEFYVGSDNFWKIMYFQDQKRVLKEAYKLDGKTKFKTKQEALDFDNQLNREAADIVKNTMPNYSMVAPFFQNLRYAPIGSFFAFRYEEIRTGFNALGLGIRQMKSSNPIIRKAGEKRTAGALGTITVGAGGVTDFTTNTVNGISDLERWALEKLKPDYNKYSRTATIVDPDTGKLSLVDMTYLDPWSDLSRPTAKLAIDAIDDKITIEEFNKGALQILGNNVYNLLEPFLAPAIAPQTLVDVFIKGRTSSGKNIFTGTNPDSIVPQAFQSQNFSNMFEAFVEDVLTPRSFTNMKNLLSSYQDQGLNKKRARNFQNELIANLTGIKIKEFKLEDNFTSTVRRYTRAKNNATRNFNNDLIYKEFENEKELEKFFDDYNNLLYSYQTSLKESVTASQVLGMSIQDVNLNLKSLGVSKRDRNNLIYNNSYLPSYLLDSRADSLIQNNPSFRKLVGSSIVFDYDLQEKINENLRNKYYGVKTLINFNYNSELERERLRDIEAIPLPEWANYIKNFNVETKEFVDGMVREVDNEREQNFEGGLQVQNAVDDPKDRINEYTGEPYSVTAGDSFVEVLERRNEGKRKPFNILAGLVRATTKNKKINRSKPREIEVDKTLTETPIVSSEKDTWDLLNINKEEVSVWKQTRDKAELTTPKEVEDASFALIDEAVPLETRVQNFKSALEKHYPIESRTFDSSQLQKLINDLPSDKEIAMSVGIKSKNKEIIGFNDTLKEGDLIELRLDIPAYQNTNTWVVTAHKPRKGKAKTADDVIGYGKTGYIKNVTFVNEDIGRTFQVQAGDVNKFPMSTMRGEWIEHDPVKLAQLAKKLIADPEWIQVGFNPKKSLQFYERETMNPLLSAEEVIQIGGFVLAKNPVKGKFMGNIFNVEGKGLRMQKPNRAGVGRAEFPGQVIPAGTQIPYSKGGLVNRLKQRNANG